MDVRFLLSGDTAVSVQFGQEISLELNQQVRALAYELEQRPIHGIVETVPTYSALMIHYRPEIIRYQQLQKQIEIRLSHLNIKELPPAIVTEIPILYGGNYGPDLEDCAKMEQITTQELIEIHSRSEYYVYMLGFAPGHAYMARFDHPFSFKRRESPRLKIPGGSVVVAQELSNLIPFDQPCGWNIIGTTPVTICNYKREKPFLVDAGQWVKFVPIDEKEYLLIKQESEKGNYQCRSYEKVVEK